MVVSNLPDLCSLSSSLPPRFGASSRYSPFIKDHNPLNHLEKECQILVGICNRVIYPIHSSQAVNLSDLVEPL